MRGEREIGRMLDERAQALLEAAWAAIEDDGLAGLDLGDGTSRAGLEALLAAGLAEQAGRRLTWTPIGRAEAARLVRRRRLAERLLADVMHGPAVNGEEQVCRGNITLQEGTEDAVCTLLGHPPSCPHGRPIPRGECCAEGRTSAGRLIAPLTEMRSGQRGEIAYLRPDHPGRLQKLVSMGVLPGVPLSLLRRSPAFVFQADHSQYAVDEAIAAGVYVRLRGDSSAEVPRSPRRLLRRKPRASQ